MVVVSVPQNNDKIRSLVDSQKWKCKILVVDNQEDRMSAMAASDMGVAMNGDAVTEAAGMQLPVLIMDTMGKWESYWTLFYNSFNNDLSVAMHGEAYPELVAMNFPEKIVELWGEWYLEPKLRYKFMKRYDKVL